MNRLPVHRIPAALLGLLLVTLALPPLPAAAVDPVPSPEVPASSVPTVHAEMAPAILAETHAFDVGAPPAPMPATAGGAVTAEGTLAALPNGLSREVFGYLPSWALTTQNLASLDYDLLSTIAYFGVAAQSTGSLAKTGDGWNGWNSTHMTNVITAAHAENVKVVLTVTMMAWDGNYANMTDLLTNSTRRTNLANDIAATVAARNADGVNLDFEPMPNSLESPYTAFVRELKAALGDGYLTVATTGGAASWDEGYELVDNGDANADSLVSAGGADAIMVMGYDFNWSGSARAGGVAPIVSPYTLDVDSAMAAYRSKVPASRLIWGVPYYGRAWTTVDDALNGRTCASAGGCDAASWAFRYVDAVEALETRTRRWDATGQVPWYTYPSTTYDTDVQAYYEDATSLGRKYDLVDGHGLRGVGIWHLLMDVGRHELWNELERNFKQLPFSDIEDAALWQHIVWLAEEGIATGCGDGRFCPYDDVRRDEMAAFLARGFELPGTSVDHFTDDDGLTLELSINRIAEAGITVGCTSTRYCPARSVKREEMASYLVRALGLPPATQDWFSDDDGETHEDANNRVAEAGIASGCAAGRFCPDAFVTREQMAAFLHRALGS
ncbi:MAG TPA: glycosyl hydrolase family 18 protein [Candidatus Limnocylindria bacterium]